MAGKGENRGQGTLFICATPIGNLNDASFRLLDTLKKADLIAAEDTRTTSKLLKRYDIGHKKMVSYHDFSTGEKMASICRILKSGLEIALVSESGMPSIQDPGYKLIRQCIRENIPVTVIPGPSAAISALVLSGLPTDSFLFLGFLPKPKGKRKDRLREIKLLPYTLIFYESPNRIVSFLKDIREVLGERKVCIAREITKIHEEVIRGKVSEVISAVEKTKIKGEAAVLAEGYSGELVKQYSDEEIKGRLMELMSEGLNKKQAMKIIRKQYDIDRQTLYNISTKI